MRRKNVTKKVAKIKLVYVVTGKYGESWLYKTDKELEDSLRDGDLDSGATVYKIESYKEFKVVTPALASILKEVK